jgi:nitrate/TMAO reductase-like tetraheme cytochrome c subunit
MRKLYSLILTMFSLSLFWGAPLCGQDRRQNEFPHDTHIVDEELECNDCHTNVSQSTKGLDDLMPEADACADCHEIDGEPEVKTSLNAAKILAYSKLFSHQLHIDEKIDCIDCHGDVAQNEAGQTVLRPDMVTCMDCHKAQYVKNKCSTCHTADEQLKPTNHNLTFMHIHGDLSRNEIMTVNNNKNCITCHTKQYCQDCHEAENIDRLTHPLNFEFTHALDAQSKESNCITCHESRSFCSDCHVDNNILPHNHTVGWSNNIPDDGGRHSLEASIDLENCMTCHERNAEEVCALCHTK